MMPAPIFAAIIVSGTMLIGGVGDFELVTPLPERICAKSAETREAARAAIAKTMGLPPQSRGRPRHSKGT